VKVLIVVMRLSYATFSFWSLIIIERILFHLPWQHGIEAIVHPADVRAALLLAAIGMSQIFMAFLMHLLFSSKYRWIFILSVTFGVATSILMALSMSALPRVVILAVYSVPQLPMLFAKIRRLPADGPGLDSETGDTSTIRGPRL
jgi:hypothetical protein